MEEGRPNRAEESEEGRKTEESGGGSSSKNIDLSRATAKGRQKAA